MLRKCKLPDSAEESRRHHKAEGEREERAKCDKEGQKAASEAQRQWCATRGQERCIAKAEAKWQERTRHEDKEQAASTEAQLHQRGRRGEGLAIPFTHVY